MSINLVTSATITAANSERRTIAGTITRYGVESNDHRFVFEAGSITPRQPLKRVKLLIDHDAAQPVGYMTELAEAGDSLTASFYVPPTPEGDAALASAAEGLRDGLSVGLTLGTDESDYTFDSDYVMHVHKAEMHEVSLCAIPAFADAQISTVAAALHHRKDTTMLTEEQLAALRTRLGHEPTNAEIAAEVARLSGDSADDGDEGDNAEDEGDSADDGDAQATSRPRTPAPRMQASGHRQGPAPARTRPRPVSLQAAAQTVADAVASGHGPAAITAALADVLPADDKGEGWLRDTWLGQLFTASPTGRPWIESLGTPKQLTSMKLKGWAWDVRPKAAKWEGNKTEVPTNKPRTKAIEGTAQRWAGGWDIDRIYLDLGEAGFLAAFWEAAMAEYKADSDADVAASIIAAATTSTTATGLLGGLSQAAAELRGIGAQLDVVKIAPDLFDVFANLRQDEVPFWLAGSIGGVNLREGSSSPAGIDIRSDDQVPAGTIVALDRRAVTVYEKTPIQLQAYDVARGGLDLGFFSYGGVLVSDKRAVRKVAVKPATQGQA